jgi:hypothetical protein
VLESGGLGADDAGRKEFLAQSKLWTRHRLGRPLQRILTPTPQQHTLTSNFHEYLWDYCDGKVLFIEHKATRHQGNFVNFAKGIWIVDVHKDTEVLVESWSDILICFYAAKISTKMVAVMTDDA